MSGAPQPAPDDGVGVYVHVPFCDRVCPYCDFAVVGGGVSDALEARYVDALLCELEARRGAFAGRALASLYLGGGTPSLLRPESIDRIVGVVRAAFDRSEGDGEVRCETTLEVNPSTVERERLPAFRAAGVDRLSVGVQSFDDGVLKRLGRAHAAAEAHRTLEATRRAGFENVSLDLIFAAPGQTLDQVRRDAEAAVAFGPEHVSTYELVVEPETPFALADRRGQLARADADGAADMLECLETVLEGAGLPAYELTNHARPGRESAHNQRYWRAAPVLGLGVGAWSTDPATAAAPFGQRHRNPRALAAYLKRAEAYAAGDEGMTFAEETEVLAPEVARGEAVFLALRTRAGLSAARFLARFGAPPRAFFGPVIDAALARGLLEEPESGDLRLSRAGWLLSDEVCQGFVAPPRGGSG